MNRSQLRSEVLSRLAESAGFFTNAEINQWLQDGVDDLTLQLEPLIKQSTTDIVSGTREYAVPTDIISIKRVTYGGSGAWANLTETTYENMFDLDADFEDDSGVPSHWYWRTDVIGLYPNPNANVTAGLRIFYTYFPTDFASDSSSTGLAVWLDPAVVLYVLYRCRLKDRDEPRATAALREYNRLVLLGARKLNKHRKEHAPQLVPSNRPYREYYQRAHFRPRLRVN